MRGGPRLAGGTRRVSGAHLFAGWPGSTAGNHEGRTALEPLCLCRGCARRMGACPVPGDVPPYRFGAALFVPGVLAEDACMSRARRCPAAPLWSRFVCAGGARGGWVPVPCQEMSRGARVAAVARRSTGEAKAPHASALRVACSLLVGGHGGSRAPRLVAGRVLIPGLLSESTHSPRLSECHPPAHGSSVSHNRRCPHTAPSWSLFPLLLPALDPPPIPTLAAAPVFFGDGAAPVSGGPRCAPVYKAGAVPDYRRHHRRRPGGPRARRVVFQRQGQGQGVAQDGGAD